MSERIHVRRYSGGRVVLSALGVCLFAAQPASSQQREPCGPPTEEQQRTGPKDATAASEHGSSRFSIRVNVQGEPFRGSVEAPVAIIEYGDYQCSFCGRFKRDIYPALDANYLKTSKLKYIYRDLPLASHRYALPAARAAYCAKEQGKYWEIHERIFALGESFSENEIAEQAEAIGLRMQDFEACVEDDRSKDEILRVAADARMMQIANTPTFLIGSQEPDGHWVDVKAIIVGAKALADYEAVIDPLITESDRAGSCRMAPQS